MARSLLAPVLFILVVVLAGSASAAPLRAERTQTLRLISTSTSQSIRDVAPKTASQGRMTKGDMIIGTSNLENAVRQLARAKGTLVGNDGFVVTVGTPPKARITVHVTLPGGTLTASGSYDLAATGKHVIQVVGGTGAFNGARGTATSSALPDGRSLNVYALRLP
jgi:Dirigent-like protein